MLTHSAVFMPLNGHFLTENLLFHPNFLRNKFLWVSSSVCL